MGDDVKLPSFIKMLTHVLRDITMEFAQADPGETSDAVDAATANPEALAAHARDAAVLRLNGEHASIPSIVRFYKRAGGHVSELMFDTFEDDEPHTMTAGAFAAVLDLASIDGYFFFTEAWIARQGVDPTVDVLRPSERMDRQEVVAVSAATPQRHILRLYPIVRGGETVTLGPSLNAPDVRFKSTLLLDLYQLVKNNL